MSGKRVGRRSCQLRDQFKVVERHTAVWAGFYQRSMLILIHLASYGIHLIPRRTSGSQENTGTIHNA
jgi:hypothetical protein